ncbi:hypothetical protein SMICM304S_11471 [Streptomyces microflavus]
MLQAYNLFPHLTVLQNITLAPQRVHGLSRADAESQARELLERLGLGGKADDTRTGSAAASSNAPRS